MTFFVLPGSATHYGDAQHGAELSNEEFLGEKIHILFPSFLRLKASDPIGHPTNDVAKDRGSTGSHDRSFEFSERGNDAGSSTGIAFIGYGNQILKSLGKRSTTGKKLDDHRIPLRNILFVVG